MKELQLKSEAFGTGLRPWEECETIQTLFTIRQEGQAYVGDVGALSMSINPILLLAKLTGAVLGGVGVITLIANILICSSLILQGPEFISKLLLG